MKKIAAFAILVLLVAGFLWAGGKKEAKQPPAPAQSETNQPAVVDEAPVSPSSAQMKLGSLGFEFPSQSFKAPDFELKNLEGVTKQLSGYEGKIVFLNFWATWCPPCQAEMPSMEKLHQTLKNEAFVMVAVDLQEDKATVEKYIRGNNYTFTVLLDETGEVGGGLYGVQGIPTTYVIGKDGYILGRLVGTREWDGDEVLSVFRDLIKG